MFGKKGRRRAPVQPSRVTTWHFVVHVNGLARTIATAKSVRRPRAVREARRLALTLGLRVGVSPVKMGAWLDGDELVSVVRQLSTERQRRTFGRAAVHAA